MALKRNKVLVRGSQGFTLVELITVIVLIGVLSALGIGLFARSSAFSPLLATQQLASATLLAQQAALAGQPNASVRIEHPAGSEPVFRAQFDPDGPGSAPPFTLQEFTLPTGGVSITVNGMHDEIAIIPCVPLHVLGLVALVLYSAT